MKGPFFVSAVIAAVVLFAASKTVVGQPAQPSQPPAEFTLALTAAEVNTIGKALAALPYGEVAPLVQKLSGQIAAQRKKPVGGLSQTDLPSAAAEEE